jgi:hypothetical protein
VGLVERAAQAGGTTLWHGTFNLIIPFAASALSVCLKAHPLGVSQARLTRQQREQIVNTMTEEPQAFRLPDALLREIERMAPPGFEWLRQNSASGSRVIPNRINWFPLYLEGRNQPPTFTMQRQRRRRGA